MHMAKSAYADLWVTHAQKNMFRGPGVTCYHNTGIAILLIFGLPNPYRYGYGTLNVITNAYKKTERGFVRKWEDFRRLLSHIEIVPPRALNDFKGCGLQQPPDTGQIFALVDLWVVSSWICGQKGFPHLPRNPPGLVGEIVSCTWRHRSTSPSTPSGPPSQG